MGKQSLKARYTEAEEAERMTTSYENAKQLNKYSTYPVPPLPRLLTL